MAAVLRCSESGEFAFASGIGDRFDRNPIGPTSDLPRRCCDGHPHVVVTAVGFGPGMVPIRNQMWVLVTAVARSRC